MGGSRGMAHKPRKIIRTIAAIVGRVLLHPLTYFVLYLSVIVGFARLYDTRRDAVFYAPYAKLEPVSREDYAAVEMNIYKAVRSADKMLRVEGTGWLVNPDNMNVSELVIDETGDFSFTLGFFATHFTRSKEDKAIGGPVENVKVSRRLIIIPDEERFCRQVSLPPDLERDRLLQNLFTQSTMRQPVLCWDGKAEYQFREMSSGWSGDPKALSGSYWRMLYLSAITITSVGYGDIIPISNTARLLCGLEAVLGWIIAGLFLSVVAVGRRRK